MKEEQFLPRDFSDWHMSVEAYRRLLAEHGGVPFELQLPDDLVHALSRERRQKVPLTREQRASLKKIIREHEDAVTFYRKLCADDLRQLLYAGELQAFVLRKSGDLFELPQSFWGDDDQFRRIAESGEAPASDGSRGVIGRVVINDNALSVKLEPYFQPVRAATASNYIPPYMEFMLRAVRELGLNPEQRVPKKRIISWLQLDWPPELGKPSDGKLNFMATFLRHPDDQSGGHFRPTRKTSGSDPEKPDK
jgi:hypothetical protein